MGFWRDIAETYVAPARVAARKQAHAPTEATLLAYLMFASLIAFFARAPRLVADVDPALTTSSFMGAQFAAAMIFGPLFLYLLAYLSQLVARIMGGTADGQGTRLALFWPLLALQPLVILGEIVSLSEPDAVASTVLSVAVAALFIYTWMRFLIVIGRDNS